MKNFRNHLNLVFAMFASLVSLQASAATISACNWINNVDYIVEPWSESTKTYANGAIRVVHMDTLGEPVCCSSHLMILAPNPNNELGERSCFLMSSFEGTGFQYLDVAGIKSSYDAELGLKLEIPVFYYNHGDDSTPGKVSVRVRQDNGSVAIED